MLPQLDSRIFELTMVYLSNIEEFSSFRIYKHRNTTGVDDSMHTMQMSDNSRADVLSQLCMKCVEELQEMRKRTLTEKGTRVYANGRK